MKMREGREPYDMMEKELIVHELSENYRVTIQDLVNDSSFLYFFYINKNNY